MTLLAVRHASLGYSRHPVLRDVSFTLSQGTICCLLGANGCGKTTLMRSILGVIPLLKGEILLDSLPVQTLSHRQRAQAIAWVPQAHDGIFAFSVLDMVLMGLAPTIGAFSVPGKQERLKATEQLEKLGILHLATRRWNTLSGGERQLALIARALIQQPRLLLLDEPASSLDFGHQIQLLDTLAQLKNNGMTMLMSTHHPLHANAIADSIIQVEPDGRVTQGLPTEQLTTNKLAALYRVSADQIHHHLSAISHKGTIMLIDDIDFADLYLQQLKLAHRTEKTPDHWDQRAEKMAENCASPTDSYLQQLTAKIDLQGAQTLFDMGCGPGTVSLALADKLTTIYGVDYSQGMLKVAARRAAALKADNVHWIQRAWEEDWSDLPRCDIAVASRSTLVADMRQAMSKLNNQARLRVYTTHLVSTSFVSPAIQRAAGREVIELPNYIFALNVLYQMGIYAHVDFIRGQNCQQDNSTWERFEQNVSWSLGALNDDERERLYRWYQQQDARALAPASRDWALIWWDSVPQETLR